MTQQRPDDSRQAVSEANGTELERSSTPVLRDTSRKGKIKEPTIRRSNGARGQKYRGGGHRR